MIQHRGIVLPSIVAKGQEGFFVGDDRDVGHEVGAGSLDRLGVHLGILVRAASEQVMLLDEVLVVAVSLATERVSAVEVVDADVSDEEGKEAFWMLDVIEGVIKEVCHALDL